MTDFHNEPSPANTHPGADPVEGTAESAHWREFGELAREALAAGKLDIDQTEREYKHALRELLRGAYEAVAEDRDGWVTELAAALDSSRTLIFHITLSRFKDVLTEQPESARAQLLDLWESEEDPKAVAAFIDFVREANSDIGVGPGLTIASVLLMAAGDSAPYQTRTVERALRLVDEEPAPTANVAERWAQFLGLLRQASEALKSAGIEADDRSHTQSILWVLLRYEADDLFDEPAASRLRRWRGEASTYSRANRINPIVEDAAWSILEAGLRGQTSPFTGGPSVWTAEAALDVVERMSVPPAADQAPGFYEHLREQFDGASQDSIQLLAELQLIRQLATVDTGMVGAKKGLAEFSAIAHTDWQMPARLERAFIEDGIFGGGPYFNQNQWRHIILGARVIAEWSTLEPGERASLMSGPWEWLDFLEDIDGDTPADMHMRMVLAYIAWPNFFHPMVSSDHLVKIRETYARFLEHPGGARNAEIQRDLFAIDQGLQRETGVERVNFYRSPFFEQWGRDTPPPPDRHNFEGAAKGIADELRMAPGELARIARVLERRRQVVFYGPPGTGKTFVARKLAQAIAGTADAVRLVQFHPSYSYEDFFEGFRPRGGEEGGGFALQHGPLRRLAASAADNPDLPHFLIIDEMNRGNLAKVFGELYFLLEYRGETASLLYSPKTEFTLPENLHIIGTMNTTDRSIGLVDAAIRRRFAFMEFHPDTAPVAGVLDRHLAAIGGDARLGTLLERLNSLIEDRDLRVGPSYFMRDDAQDSQGLRDIWDFDILPLLYEHYYGHRTPAEIREEFALDQFLDSLDH